jgi:hypothetical protein
VEKRKDAAVAAAAFFRQRLWVSRRMMGVSLSYVRRY